MTWKDTIRKNALDGSDMTDDEYNYYYGDGSESEGYSNPPRGAEREKKIKVAWDKEELEGAVKRIRQAFGWLHPTEREDFNRQLRMLMKEAKKHKQEALDYHGGKLEDESWGE